MDSSELEPSARLLRAILERGDSRRPAKPEAPPRAGSRPEAARPGIEGALAGICAAPAVRAAVLADANGLIVASRGEPLASERLAACAVALGATLDQAGRLLETEPGNRAAVRLASDEEALLFRFRAGDRHWHLLVLRDARSPGRSPLERAADVLAEALSLRLTGAHAP